MRVTIYKNPHGCETHVELNVEETKKILSETLKKMGSKGDVAGVIITVD